MNDLDWDAEFDFVTSLNKCSDNLMLGSPTAASKKTRKNVERAFEAVKEIKKESPDSISKRAFRKKVYKFLIPGIWSFILPLLISVVLRLVVEYLIGRLFQGEGEQIAYGDVHLPPE